MKNSTKYYIFLFTRNFLPMAPYLAPFTLETKQIPKNKLLNKVTPKIFIATIFTAIISPFLIEAFGKKLICVTDNLLECISYCIFFFMPQNNIFLCEIAATLHGITKSLESISKSIMYDGDPERSSEKYAIYSAVKQLATTVSAISGQEFFYMTNSYSVLVYVSLISIIFSFFFSLFFLEELEKKHFDFYVLFSVKKMFSELKNEFSFSVFIFSLFYVISTTLLIALSVYSTYIFIERKDEIDIHSSRLGSFFYLLFTPFRYFFFLVAKLVSFFDKSIKVDLKYNKNVVLFGYVNALCRVISIIPKYTIMKIEFTFYNRAYILIIFIFIIMIILYQLYKINSLFWTYLLAIISLFLSFTCLGISNNGFKNHSKSHVIYSFNLLFSALIHSCISYYSMSKKSTAARRLVYYSYVDGLLILIGISLIVLHKYSVF